MVPRPTVTPTAVPQPAIETPTTRNAQNVERESLPWVASWLYRFALGS